MGDQKYIVVGKNYNTGIFTTKRCASKKEAREMEKYFRLIKLSHIQTYPDPVRCAIQDITEALAVDGITRDMDSEIHKGFSVGDNGRRLYWEIIFHASGNATAYRWTQSKYRSVRRFIPHGTMITVHFK